MGMKFQKIGRHFSQSKRYAFLKFDKVVRKPVAILIKLFYLLRKKKILVKLNKGS